MADEQQTWSLFEPLESRLLFDGSAASVMPSSPSASPDTIGTATAPQYALTPSVLSSLRSAAAANAPQWVAFKAYLDAGLNRVTEGDYEGFELPPIADYALGYRVLENLDPVTAGAYA